MNVIKNIKTKQMKVRDKWNLQKHLLVKPAVINWVAITEKMPESGFCILLYSKSGGVAEGSWIGEKGHFEQWRWNSIKDDVTHWAELPEPPCV